MKTILLTGVTGWVGSALAPLLQGNGYEFCEIANHEKQGVVKHE